jgi:hypothetical protein
MTRLWKRLRAILRGPSDEALALDLAIIRRRLNRLEAAMHAEATKLTARDPNVVRFIPSRHHGLEG